MAAITYDASGFSYDAASVTTHNATNVITIGAGSNRLLIAFIMFASTATLTSVTLDPTGTPQAFTIIGLVNNSNQKIYAAYLKNPASGLKSVRYVVSSAIDADLIVQSYSNCYQVIVPGIGPLTTAVQSSSQSDTVSDVNPLANSDAWALSASRNSSLGKPTGAGANLTQRATSTLFAAGDTNGTLTASTNTTLHWTYASNSGTSEMISFIIANDTYTPPPSMGGNTLLLGV